MRRAQRKRLRKNLAGLAASTLLEVIGEVPGLKTALKVQRTAQSIRDELFEDKVASFLGEVDAGALRRFVDELATDAGARKKAGQALVLILDRLDDMEKPAIIGRLYRAALERRITLAELRRFCMIVDRAHLPDLVALSQYRDPARVEEVFGPQLHTLGLLSVTGEDYGTIDGVGAKTWYEVNDLGKKFLGAAFPAGTK